MSETELCRLCAKVADERSAEKLFKRNKRKLLRQIEELIGQRLKNAKDLPQHICKPCEEQTLQAHEFRKSCIQTQQHLAAHRKESNQHKKPKPKDVVSAPIEEVVVDELNTFKEEEYIGASPLPHITEVVFKNEPTNSNVELKSGNDSEDSFNPLEEDLLNATVEEDMKTLEPETSLLSADEKPYKNQKSKGKIKNSRQRSNEKKFICDQCGKHFASNSDLESHIRRHTGEKLFKCEICPESFFLKVGLKRHIRKHAGELPHPCGHCERRFLDKCHAMKHERTHTNERPYICQQCGKGFTVSHILKAHMLVHTGERAFGCRLCNAAFKFKKHLVTHYRSMTHKQMEEKQQMSSN